MSLFQRCSPTTVTRFVVTVTIWIAVNGMLSAWPASHIGNEIGKVQPSFTNLDSFSAIHPKVISFRIFATLNHCAPDSIFRPEGTTMARSTQDSTLALKASATLACTVRQVTSSNNSFDPTLAAAKPMSLEAPAFSSTYYSPSPKCFASQVNQLRHIRIVYHNSQMQVSEF